MLGWTGGTSKEAVGALASNIVKAVPTRAGARAPTGAGPVAAPGRLYHLDYLRAGVVALVMVHHTAITYGGAGSWYFSDPTHSKLLAAGLSWLTAWNQAWFMGFLFFLSGYLSLASYQRKGPGVYLLDRLRRFGIPLLVYTFGISPLVSWMALAAGPGGHPPFISYWVRQLGPQTADTGVMWFVWALLLMDGMLVVWVRFVASPNGFVRAFAGFPSPGRLAAFAIGVGAVAFLVRLTIPTGASVLWGLQLGYFPGYVAAFVAGIAAWRGRWLDDIPDAAFRFARTAVIVATLAFPMVLIMLVVSTPNPGPAVSGGLHWQSLAYAMWEPWLLVGMSICLLRWGQRRLNAPSPLYGWATGSYVAYMIQPIFIVGLAILLRGSAMPPIVRFPLVAAGAIVLAYAVARGLRAIAPVRTVVG